MNKQPHPYQPHNVNTLHAAEKATANFNDKLAILLTNAVSTMWCAYLFFLLAMAGFPGPGASPQAYVQWVSQTVIQLVMLAVIMKGQALLGRHQELQSDEQFKMTEKICHDNEVIISLLTELKEQAHGQ